VYGPGIDNSGNFTAGPFSQVDYSAGILGGLFGQP
jgi:hypothetical protein